MEESWRGSNLIFSYLSRNLLTNHSPPKRGFEIEAQLQFYHPQPYPASSAVVIRLLWNKLDHARECWQLSCKEFYHSPISVKTALRFHGCGANGTTTKR